MILPRTILVFGEFRFTPKSKFGMYWHPHIPRVSTWARTTVALEKWEKALESTKIQMIWPWAWCDINDLTAIPSTSAQSMHVAGWNEYNSCSQEIIISASHHSCWVVKLICISFLLQYIHDLIGVQDRAVVYLEARFPYSSREWMDNRFAFWYDCNPIYSMRWIWIWFLQWW